MIFSQFQREDADNVFTIVRNVAGGSRSAGAAVVWDISASVDGVRVTDAAAATLSLFRGILTDTLTDSQYGKCQIHGYNTVASVYNGITAIAAGNKLLPAAALTGLVFGAVGTGDDGFVYAAEARASVTQTTLSAASAMKVLIRAL